MIARRIPTEMVGTQQGARDVTMRAMQVGEGKDDAGALLVTVALADWNGDAHMVALLIPDARELAGEIVKRCDALEAPPKRRAIRAPRKRLSTPEGT